MKKSISYWTLGGFNGEVPILEAAKTADSLGFDAIELCYGAGELTPAAGKADLVALKKAFDKEGLKISSMASGNYWGVSLSSLNEAERSEAIAFTRAYIEAAAAFKVEHILVVPGAVDVPWDPSRGVVPAKEAWELSTQSLEAVLPLAEEKGVTICVENVWNKFLTGPFEYASFIDSFNSPRLKAYFDCGNVLVNGYPEHWIEILGGRIGRVHVKNFKRQSGGGTLDGFTSSLMDGDMNWPAVLGALKSAGYDSYLTGEMLVTAKGLPDVDMARQTCIDLESLIEQYA